VLEIYNAKSPISLTREIRIFRQGELLTSLPAAAISGSAGANGAILISGTIRLTQAVAPGQYVLQVIIRDTVADRVGEQSIDFEVLP
jgi:hypothetical protein